MQNEVFEYSPAEEAWITRPETFSYQQLSTKNNPTVIPISDALGEKYCKPA